jgi:hypothetical protein
VDYLRLFEMSNENIAENSLEKENLKLFINYLQRVVFETAHSGWHAFH